MSRTFTEWYEDTITRFLAWRRWHKATGYQHMTRMRAEHLAALLSERTIEDPDSAVVKMLTAQLLLNEHGIFAYAGQPGGGYEPECGGRIEHRAALVIIAADSQKDWLEDRLWKAGLLDHSRTPGESRVDLAVLELHDPEDRTKYGPVGDGAVDGFEVSRVTYGTWHKVVGRIGQQMTAAEIHDMFPVRPDAAAQLYRGWQIVLTAQEYGDNTMFDKLAEIVRDELTYRQAVGGTGPFAYERY